MWTKWKYFLLAAPLVILSRWFRFYSQPSTFNTSTLIQQQQLRATPQISFYKLCLQWPPATCHGTLSCNPPIPSDFTIHGIWPQDRDDVPIPPYDGRNPCTRKRPTPPRDLPNILHPIDGDLTSLWPNLTDGLNSTANYQFWKNEWKRHGTCSDYPDDPFTYFNSALHLRRGLRTIVRFRPGTTKTVQEFVDEVFDVLKAYPEIACNENPNHPQKQLWEIRLCYNRSKFGKLPNKLLNCTHQLPERNGSIIGPCQRMTDPIIFRR